MSAPSNHTDVLLAEAPCCGAPATAAVSECSQPASDGVTTLEPCGHWFTGAARAALHRQLDAEAQARKAARDAATFTEHQALADAAAAAGHAELVQAWRQAVRDESDLAQGLLAALQVVAA